VNAYARLQKRSFGHLVVPRCEGGTLDEGTRARCAACEQTHGLIRVRAVVEAVVQRVTIHAATATDGRLRVQAEVERLLFEDPDEQLGFMLHPDMKWDQTQMNGLYCLAICHRRDVRSLRDLNASHLPMLRNIRDKSLAAIKVRRVCCAYRRLVTASPPHGRPGSPLVTTRWCSPPSCEVR
jgi:hypothetical protein